jgi:hypothetical protein
MKIRPPGFDCDPQGSIEAFRNLPLDQWDWHGWHGFYAELQRVLGDGEWGYVANPAGGFLGYWWHWHAGSHSEQYLQLEQSSLCFKISVDDSAHRSDERSRWLQQILAAAQTTDIAIIRPRRLGTGQTMTVAILDDKYRKVDSSWANTT